MRTKLERLQHKNSKLVVGLMSGTSVDGVDAALVKITGHGERTRVRLLALDSKPFPKGFREEVLKNSLPGTGSVDFFCRLNMLLPQFYADAVRRAARKGGVPLDRVDLIGVHGQTVHHLPKPERLYGKTIRSTFQTGDVPALATLTGIVTVGNFRTADMALGGQGAPLVPYVDYLLMRSEQRNRLLLNLGGIANFTVLPRRCGPDEVTAFDTGPANMIIDALMKQCYGRGYDRNGTIAARGRVDQVLLDWMMSHPYFDQKPPKSTGRELFGRMFVDAMLKRARGLSRVDCIATATEFTACSVYDQYRRFVAKRCAVEEVLVSGGGARNATLMRALAARFVPATVGIVDDAGMPSEAKEALCFAVLANETIHERGGNLPSVTGAARRAVLGCIAVP